MLSHADVSQSVSAVISYESVLFHFLISWGQMCVCASQTFFFSKLSVSICPIHGKKSESYFPIPNMRSWKKPSTRTRIFLGTKGGKWRRLWTFLKTASTWMLILIYYLRVVLTSGFTIDADNQWNWSLSIEWRLEGFVIVSYLMYIICQGSNLLTRRLQNTRLLTVSKVRLYSRNLRLYNIDQLATWNCLGHNLHRSLMAG